MVRGGVRRGAHGHDHHAHVHHRALTKAMRRLSVVALGAVAVLGTPLLAAPAAAHQDTTAYSRMVIRENGDVEYALKIPVEDLAEALGRSGHAALNAPEVRAAEQLLFRHFQPLVGMTAAGQACSV